MTEESSPDDGDDHSERTTSRWFSFGTSVERLDEDAFREKLDPEARAWFQTHDVELGSEDESDDSGNGDGDDESGLLSSLASQLRGSTAGSTPGQTKPAPQSDPVPEPSAHSRGTFAFPPDEQFLQALEIRAKNGARRRVETVYALTGPSYTDPTDLFALDDPDYYESATRTSVVSIGSEMANAVARQFPDGETPKLIARFHTHPGGSTTPSDTDRDSAMAVRNSFESAFGTDDFEFFHGIHAYSERSEQTNTVRTPEQVSNTVSWDGEQYRHTLALYGPRFRNPREVGLRDQL